MAFVCAIYKRRGKWLLREHERISLRDCGRAARRRYLSRDEKEKGGYRGAGVGWDVGEGPRAPLSEIRVYRVEERLIDTSNCLINCSGEGLRVALAYSTLRTSVQTLCVTRMHITSAIYVTFFSPSSSRYTRLLLITRHAPFAPPESCVLWGRGESRSSPMNMNLYEYNEYYNRHYREAYWLKFLLNFNIILIIKNTPRARAHAISNYKSL